MDCPPGQKKVAVIMRWPLWRVGPMSRCSTVFLQILTQYHTIGVIPWGFTTFLSHCTTDCLNMQVATLFCDIYSASLMPPLLLGHKKEGDFNQCSVLNVFTMILQLYDWIAKHDSCCKPAYQAYKTTMGFEASDTRDKDERLNEANLSNYFAP